MASGRIRTDNTLRMVGGSLTAKQKTPLMPVSGVRLKLLNAPISSQTYRPPFQRRRGRQVTTFSPPRLEATASQPPQPAVWLPGCNRLRARVSNADSLFTLLNRFPTIIRQNSASFRNCTTMVPRILWYRFPNIFFFKSSLFSRLPRSSITIRACHVVSVLKWQPNC